MANVKTEPSPSNQRESTDAYLAFGIAEVRDKVLQSSGLRSHGRGFSGAEDSTGEWGHHLSQTLNPRGFVPAVTVLVHPLAQTNRRKGSVCGGGCRWCWWERFRAAAWTEEAGAFNRCHRYIQPSLAFFSDLNCDSNFRIFLKVDLNFRKLLDLGVHCSVKVRWYEVPGTVPGTV